MFRNYPVKSDPFKNLNRITMKRPDEPISYRTAGNYNGPELILSSKEGKYRSIVENSIHAFFLTLSDGSILEINHAACRMFGYPPAELKKLKRWDFIDHDDPRLLNALDQREKNGFAMTEATAIKKNGERFPVEITSALFTDTDGIRKTSTMVSDISVRKKAEKLIEESEQRYKIFIQETTEGIWRIELNEPIDISAPVDEMVDSCFEHAYIAECNDAYAAMYGFEKAAELTGIPLKKIWPKENAICREYFTKFFTNNFRVTQEISNEFNRNGDEITFINTLTGIVEGNLLKRAWGIRKNITQQKKAETALAESEYRLRAIIHTDPECIKLLSREGTILEMNPAGLAMIEAESPDQVIGKNAYNIIMPGYQDGFKKMVQHVFEGRKEKMLFRIRGLKGRELWMETHCVPFRNAAGEITAMLSVTRDITESKNAQAQLLASEEQYRQLFNNNPASILIWDLETLNIIEVNETAISLYGYSKDEFQQLTVLDIRPEEDHDKFLELVEQAREDKFAKKTMRWRHLNSKGNVIMMEISSHNIIYKGYRAVLAMCTDITEKVRLENSLNEERKIRHKQITEAVITGQEKERMQLGEELHDNINQILASTKLFLECSLKDKNPRTDLVIESKHLVEKAMTEIRKLSKSLLPPSLGEVGLLQALNELADTIKQVNELSVSIQWKDVCENELSNKLKLTVFRIVQEQLNNVIKHADAGNIVISLSKSENALCVIVKDNGKGFEPELKRNGVGIRNITSRAEVNNGTVFINSKPGEGCELIVNFPLAKKQ